MLFQSFYGSFHGVKTHVIKEAEGEPKRSKKKSSKLLYYWYHIWKLRLCSQYYNREGGSLLGGAVNQFMVHKLHTAHAQEVQLSEYLGYAYKGVVY